jgi:TonB family protein
MKTLTKILGALALTLAQAVAQTPGQSAPPTAATANAAQPASGTDIPAAHPISTVDPKYPKEARKQKRQGAVVLHVKIGEDGKVQDLSVVSGDPDFAAAATQAVKKWSFQPYLVDGKPTEAEQRVTVNFTLPIDAPPPDSSQTLSDDDFNKGVDARVAAGSLLRLLTGPGVTPPKAIHTTDPDYSQEAKDARVQGTVVLRIILEADGVPGEIHVSRSMGHGLDEKAIEAVRRWKFAPATKDGKPVAVVINIEVKFHLY